MKIALAALAATFALVGNVPYLRDVLRRRIQPHPYTWLVWSCVSAITLAGQYAKGAGIGALPTAVAESFTIIIFVFSLQYGFRNIKRVDTVFLVLALLGLVPWVLTSDPTWSVVVVVAIDLVAFVPTLRKTWRQPASETPMLYSMNVFRHVLTLGALHSYNVATTLHSLAMIVTNSLMTLLILRGNKPVARHAAAL